MNHLYRFHVNIDNIVTVNRIQCGFSLGNIVLLIRCTQKKLKIAKLLYSSTIINSIQVFMHSYVIGERMYLNKFRYMPLNMNEIFIITYDNLHPSIVMVYTNIWLYDTNYIIQKVFIKCKTYLPVI